MPLSIWRRKSSPRWTPASEPVSVAVLSDRSVRTTLIFSALVAFTQANRVLLLRFDADRVLGIANLVNCLFCLVLLATAVTNAAGLIGMLVPLFFVVSLRGLTFPNASAGALAPFPRKAGSASALLGSLQFAIAAIASAAAGVLHNGTAVPMAAVITVCGLLAFVSYRWLALKK